MRVSSTLPIAFVVVCACGTNGGDPLDSGSGDDGSTDTGAISDVASASDTLTSSDASNTGDAGA